MKPSSLPWGTGGAAPSRCEACAVDCLAVSTQAVNRGLGRRKIRIQEVWLEQSKRNTGRLAVAFTRDTDMRCCD